MKKLISLSAVCSMVSFCCSVSGLETMKKLALGTMTFESSEHVSSVRSNLDSRERKASLEVKSNASAPRQELKEAKKDVVEPEADKMSLDEDADGKVASVQEQLSADLDDKAWEARLGEVLGHANIYKEELILLQDQLKDLSVKCRELQEAGKIDFDEIDSEIWTPVSVDAVSEDCKCPDKIANVQDLKEWIRYSKETQVKIEDSVRGMVSAMLEKLHKCGEFDGLEDKYEEALHHCQISDFNGVLDVFSRCLISLDGLGEKFNNRTQSPRDELKTGDAVSRSGKKRRRSLSAADRSNDKGESVNATPNSSSKKRRKLSIVDGPVNE